jgi:hypothetical protein
MGVTVIKRDGLREKRGRRWKVLALAVAAVALVPVLAALATFAQTAPAPAQMPVPKLLPEKIAMGAFYNGARVRIEGTAPPGSGVLVVIEGSERDEFFNRKGRVGPIWLTVDRIHVQHAPSVFLSFGSSALSSLLDRQGVEEYQLDEAAIMQRIHVLCHCKCSLTNRAQQSGIHDTVPDPTYAHLLYADFLRLKQHEGNYRQLPGAVSLVSASSGTRYALEFEWPKQAPAGNYQVAVYACRGRRVIARSTTTLQLVEVGFPEYMATMAAKKPWLYGSAAVLAAIAAGFLTDLLTSSLRRKRRAPKTTKMSQPGTPIVEPGEKTAESHKTESAPKPTQRLNAQEKTAGSYDDETLQRC